MYFVIAREIKLVRVIRLIGSQGSAQILREIENRFSTRLRVHAEGIDGVEVFILSNSFIDRCDTKDRPKTLQDSTHANKRRVT
jgi:hypothetical protein